MALEQPGFEIGFMDAAASLATKQYYCVKVTADHAVNICTWCTSGNSCFRSSCKSNEVWCN